MAARLTNEVWLARAVRELLRHKDAGCWRYGCVHCKGFETRVRLAMLPYEMAEVS